MGGKTDGDQQMENWESGFLHRTRIHIVKRPVGRPMFRFLAAFLPSLTRTSARFRAISKGVPLDV